MREFLLLTVCVFGTLAQVPNLQQAQGGFGNNNGNLFGPGVGMPQPGANPNLQTGGFSTPFGPFGQTGMPFGAGGIGGQVFGGRGRFPGQGPLTPMARMMMSLARNPNNYRYATCTFNDTWTMVRGRADFRQFLIGQGNQEVHIRVQITGLPQAVSEVERGIHVHEFGDIGDGCSRVGPHFNPHSTPHGSQRSFAYMRHVGDLGNIRQSADGQVSTQFVDQVVSLEGTNSIVGRSLVITYERDDEGMGDTRESLINGNTHNPIACCTIGRTTAGNWYNPLTADDIQSMAATGLMPDNRIDPMNAASSSTNTNINNQFNPNMPNPNNLNPNTFNPGFIQPGTPGFTQPGTPGFTQPGTPGFTQPGTAGFTQPGFTGFTQPGTPGFTQPGTPGFTQPGTPGFIQPGMTGFTQQGTPGFMQPGMPGFMQPGTPGFNQPGTTGFNQPGATSFTQPGGLGFQPGTGFTPTGFQGTGATFGGGPAGFGGPGFGGTGTAGFGAGTFTPGAAPGQTFNTQG